MDLLKKRLCVIIINYKTPELTLNCIDSLCPQLDKVTDHIIVVDNNSGGKDIEKITTGLAERSLNSIVSLISSPENNGFSAGNNIGIKAVEAKLYLLANADTLFRPESLQCLIETALDYPDAGIISPRLEWLDQEPQVSCFRYFTPLSEIIYASGISIVENILNKYAVPLKLSNDISFPEWTSFACVLIKDGVFQKIGYLDEAYFMYYEDADYCRRAKNAGFMVVNNPVSHVVHLRGQSSGIKKIQKEKKRLPDYYHKSRARYYTKFYGYFGFLLSNICWLIGRSISLTLEKITGKERTVPEEQYKDIWKQ